MTTSRRRKTKRTTGKNQPAPFGVLMVGGAAVIVALVVILVSLNQTGARTVDAGAYQSFPDEWVQRNELGNPDAPVTVAIWEDFLCPACAQWAVNIKPLLVEQYVLTGEVKLAYRHFPLSQHEPGASLGAQASECAADQGAFWPYRDRVYQESAARGESALVLEKLVEYGADLGLDVGQFSQCMNSQKHWNGVRQSAAQAIALNLNATPSALVNGHLLPNPFDYQAMAAEIDRLVIATQP
jgi:protein-disulfide isomerase